VDGLGGGVGCDPRSPAETEIVKRLDLGYVVVPSIETINIQIIIIIIIIIIH
jgi:hypothetical protein